METFFFGLKTNEDDNSEFGSKRPKSIVLFYIQKMNYVYSSVEDSVTA